MDALDFRDTEFFLDRSTTFSFWLKPIVLAVLIHIVIFAGSVTLPNFFHKRPILDEIVTVNLIDSATLERPAEGPPPAIEKPVVSKPEPVKPTKSAVRVPSQPQPQVTPVPAAKPVSIRPLKRKVRKAKDTRLAEERNKERRKIADQKAKQRQKEERDRAIAKAEFERKKADEEVRRAREELASLLRVQNTTKPASTSRSKSSGSGKLKSIVLKQYLSEVDSKLRRYWVLPEMRKWHSGLEAVVVIVIKRDGSVKNIIFERKSSDPFYDQFVMKTIQSAIPMPRFPAVLKQDSLEVGIRFRPGELLM